MVVESDTGHLSQLESLPVELIQQIFFHALEVNLPRASNYLRQVLSTESTYNALITLAYFDDDGQSPVATKYIVPAKYHVLPVNEKVRLQSGILSCRWCSHERIRSCLGALSQLVMHQAWYRETHDFDLISAGASSQDVRVTNRFLESIAQLPEIDELERLAAHFMLTDSRLGIETSPHSVSTRQTQDAALYWATTRMCIITWTFKLDEHGQIHKATDYGLSTLAARSFPDWLVSKCFASEDSVRFLQLLRQGYTFIREEHVVSITAKAVFTGLAGAIRSHNVVALKTLLEIHNAFFKSGGYGLRQHMGRQLIAPSHHPIPASLFHLVTQQAEHDSEMMSLLLRAAIDTVHPDDECITAWAVKRADEGCKVASWLLKHMEGTSHYGLPPRGYLFVDGCLSWRRRAVVEFPFPETSFAAELGYLPGSTVIPTGPGTSICGES